MQAGLCRTFPWRLLAGFALSPLLPTRDRNNRVHRTDSRQTVRRSWRRWYSCIRFFTNSIRFFGIIHAFHPPFTKKSNKVFHLYRYKKSEKLSPENQIFQKFELPNSSQRGKNRLYYCVNCGRSVFPLPGSVRAADKQYTVLHCHRRSEVINCVKGDCCSQQTAGSGNL